jgi:glycosyltransferase involved in cell wall biosynthesis
VTGSSAAGRRRPKLLGVGYGVAGYGFGRVFGSLYDGLAGCWEIEHLEFSPPGARAADAPWPVHNTRRPALHYGHLEFAELLDAREPDLVFLSLDVWQLPPYLKAVADARVAPRTVAYCPVDTPLPPGLELGPLAGLDVLVAPTGFGRDQVEAALQRQGVAPRCGVCVIPHGVDVSRFHPLESEPPRDRAKRARAELFPRESNLEDAFIVLNANRNQRRKRLDLTLEGFAIFAAGKPDTVKLMLHSGTIDIGASTVALAHTLGILDRVLWTRHDRAHPVVSDERLNLVYNACQVGINTCTSEGWGLVAFEHAATGAAQVVPGHSACGELWRDAAATVLPASPYMFVDGVADGGVVRSEDAAAALERLYREPALLAQWSRLALENARRPELRWQAVAARFASLFDELMT